MNINNLINQDISTYRKVRNLHIIILVLCVVLFASVIIEMFGLNNILSYRNFLKIQLVICCLFILDFFIELFLFKNKWKYIYKNIFFLLVSIPYLSIFEHYHIEYGVGLAHFLKLAPLFRGIYAISIVIGWFSRNSAFTLFNTYLVIIVSAITFSSMIFYDMEKPVNCMVRNYGDALWWAFMDVTTVGSDINAQTTSGKILSVFLAGLGMMMFPIFTVYITNKIQELNDNKRTDQLKKSENSPTDDKNA